MSNTEESNTAVADIAVPASEPKGIEQAADTSGATDATSVGTNWPAEGQGAGADGAKLAGSGTPGAWPSHLPPLPSQSAGADLPIANISRIMKRALPDNGKIAKNAKECMQECVSELISFITSEASDRCGSEKRKTINGDDILYSLRVLGFDNYEQVLKVYLSRYRQAQEENPRQRRRRSTKRRSSAQDGSNPDEATPGGTMQGGDDGDEDGDDIESDEEAEEEE
ncbi:transcriptional activator hap3 [Malassezia japonica]|uniref:Transcriptional activator hap3 n=1 Tax=Malassezia japonica TaxID=223818 RepID=A0AAF0F5E6_9BASI|nr:transcriptional activator hap3 [Malassezia japonica]WFD38767.1 transcriptional activator hap3 [Malassezia japonica]